MSFVAIGTPGQNVRSLMQAMSDEETARQTQPGEVAIATPVLGEFAVSADGKSLVPATIPLPVLQARRWGEAKIYRDNVALGGCSTPKGKVQTDDTSVARIAAFAATAQGAPSDWSVAWIMADNSSVAHNAVEMIAMNASVTAFLNSCQTASAAIRAAISATTTADAVSALDITDGYPN